MTNHQPTPRRARRLAEDNGCKVPAAAWAAHTETGVPYYVVCAILEKETGGGANVYGHDVFADGSPKPFWGHGEVTKANYQAYLRERDLGVREARFRTLGRRMQGVGPMQLTWWAYQDRADTYGGCWRVGPNVLVGAQVLAENRKAAKSWRQAAARYNGSAAYGEAMVPLFAKWRDLLGGL